MHTSVLQPVERRRRKRRLRPLALLLLSAALGAVALAFSQHWIAHGAAEPASPRAARAAVPPAPPRPTPRSVAAPAPAKPLLVYAPAAPPFRGKLSARSAVLVDASTGAVLWAKHAHARRAIASTTKIMTAVLALERLNPGQRIEIARSVPRVQPFREGLRPHEHIQAWKLLYSLLLYSGNDDALALAIGAAGSRSAFVALMNEKARELGLRDSHFSSPSGVIDRGNRSSAWDLAALARYAMRDSRFRSIVRTRIARVRWEAPTYGKVYVNRNHLLGTYPGADGIKTGWTTVAGHCLVASAHRGGVRLIAVVLHSSDPYIDARRLLDYGFRLRKAR
jgi:D-alanyl-D-alanine carboxypeptidase (penicillin-binding protein 5/6)